MTSTAGERKSKGGYYTDVQGYQVVSEIEENIEETDVEQNHEDCANEQCMNISGMSDQSKDYGGHAELANSQEICDTTYQVVREDNCDSCFENYNTEISLNPSTGLPPINKSTTNSTQEIKELKSNNKPAMSENQDEEQNNQRGEQIREDKSTIFNNAVRQIVCEYNPQNQINIPTSNSPNLQIAQTSLINDNLSNSFSSCSGEQNHPCKRKHIVQENNQKQELKNGRNSEDRNEVVIAVIDDDDDDSSRTKTQNFNNTPPIQKNQDLHNIQTTNSCNSSNKESDKNEESVPDVSNFNQYFNQGEIPQHFICPITKDIMAQPVVLVSTGQIYDRKAIQEWFQNGHRTCPVTGQTVASLMLQDLHPLRSAIYEFAARVGIEIENCEQVANSEEFMETTMHAQITAADLLNAYLTIRIREREQSQAGERVLPDPVARRNAGRNNNNTTRGLRVNRANLRIARQTIEREEEHQRQQQLQQQQQQLSPQSSQQVSYCMRCRKLATWMLAVMFLILYLSVFGYLIYATAKYTPALAVFLSILCVMLLLCPPQVTRPWFLNLRHQQQQQQQQP